MTSQSHFSVEIKLGASRSIIEGVMTTEHSWQTLSDQEIRDALGRAYRSALKSVLQARKEQKSA
jgi:hypothetical protein